MTDEEFLADVTAQNTYDITREEFERLVALARIGAAVKPRAIEEAKKDGRPILAWSGSFLVAHWMFGWKYSPNHVGPVDGWIVAGGSVIHPSAFYDLSALPTPQE